MKNIDLLFIPEYSNLNTDFLDDIEFSCLQNILLTNEFEFFSKIISKPLIDEVKIIERQNIFKDLIKYPNLLDRLTNIYEEAQKNIMPKFNIIYSSHPPKKILKEYYKVVIKSLNVAGEIYEEIRNNDFVSNSFVELRNQLKKSSDISELKMRITNLVNDLIKDNISLQVSYGKTFKLKYANVYSSGRIMLSQTKKSIFSKSKVNSEGSSYGYDFIADLQIAHMLESSVKNMSNTLNQLNSHIISFCKDLSVQLSFYMIGLKIIKYLQNKGATVVFPNIAAKTLKICTKDLQDIGLIVKHESSKDVISNIFNSEKSSFYLISGVNQGGKTTFIKSIGMAQVLAQNGLPVVSNEYNCPIFDSLVSHFPKGEDDKLDSGKLEEELTRLKRDLPYMANKALILMNESFATTTEKEGAEIAVDTLRALSITDSLILFVTHNYVLLKNIDEYSGLLENNTKLKSLITIKGDSATSRTYKIIEAKPQDEIDTIEFLEGRFVNI